MLIYKQSSLTHRISPNSIIPGGGGGKKERERERDLHSLFVHSFHICFEMFSIERIEYYISISFSNSISIFKWLIKFTIYIYIKCVCVLVEK